MELYVSKGEALFLDRRHAGASQPQWASHLGMDFYEYRRIEIAGPKENTAKDIRRESTYGDYCAIIRRRLGLTQQEVAEKLGTTRFRVNRMELDEIPNSELVDLMRSLL